MTDISLNNFLKISHDFKLGNLVTEMAHPKTTGLSKYSIENLEHALKIIKDVDLEMLSFLQGQVDYLDNLRIDISKTFQSGGRVFICGCGATGRLALALETIWRQETQKENIVGFMAGGDIALIHSIEKFEDYADFGAKQLKEVGFNSNDLLISATEGGETTFVIGATEEAASLSKRAPYFLYCNPDDILCATAKRSKAVIDNTKIKKINLTSGPQVLTGSTRMQASSILMLAIGSCLFNFDKSKKDLADDLANVFQKYRSIDIRELKSFIEKESEIYLSKKYLTYLTSAELGITVLTDTTERSPTFSLHPFENTKDKGKKKKASLCYLAIEKTKCSKEAWHKILGRPPRALEWDNYKNKTGLERLYGFDVCQDNIKKRNEWTSGEQEKFNIKIDSNDKLTFALDDLNSEIFSTKNMDRLSIHIILKMLLNTHSTLVMGRLGRYQSNIMTWVRASNYKLIDRTIRYIQMLLKENGQKISYQEVAKKCFEIKNDYAVNESLVLGVFEELKSTEKRIIGK